MEVGSHEPDAAGLVLALFQSQMQEGSDGVSKGPTPQHELTLEL